MSLSEFPKNRNKMHDIKPPKNDGGFGDIYKFETNVRNYHKYKYKKAVERDIDIDIGIKEPVADNNTNIKDHNLKNLNNKNIYFRNKKKKKLNFLNWMLVFVVLFFVLFISFIFLFEEGKKTKNSILNNTFSAYKNMISAQEYLKKMDLEKAGFEFSEANVKFSLAKDLAESFGGDILSFFAWLPGFSQYQSGYNLLKIGVDLSYVGEIMSFSVEPLFKLSPEDFFVNNNNLYSKNLLSSVFYNINLASKTFDDVEKSFKNVNPYDFPDEFQNSVWELKNKFPEIKKKMNSLSEASAFLSWFLGEDNPKNFLLITQNTREARATGGFIGSYGLIKTEFGFIKDIFVDDIYNIDGQLIYKVVPPRPIQKISTAWSMHDANWFFDFPTSAKKISFFYEKSGGVTPDGIVAINEKFMEGLVGILGPIKMDDYNITLTKDNFSELIQKEVEENYDKALNRPKKILDDMIPLIFSKISKLEKRQFGDVLNFIISSLDSKDIIIWANDKNQENYILKNNWGGKVRGLVEGEDYLAVVNSNINGFKTDGVVNQKIKKTTTILADGEIINTVVVEREHKGGKESSDWFNKVNSNYIRIYVPLGSEFISSSGNTKEEYKPFIDYNKAGFNSDRDVVAYEKTLQIKKDSYVDVFEESGKTVFGAWLYVSPGESVKFEIKYKLPFKIDKSGKGDDIGFYFQSQPGSESYLDFNLKLPEKWGYIYSVPKNIWGKYQGEFKKDLSFSFGLEY